MVCYSFAVDLLLDGKSVKGSSLIKEKYGPCSPTFAPVVGALVFVYLHQREAIFCCEGQRLGSATHGETSGMLGVASMKA